MKYFSKNNTSKTLRTSGFTIVELLIVVVVIGILAAITIVSYNGITKRATETVLKADLRNGASQLTIASAESARYPSPDLPSSIKASAGNTFQYTSDGATFCLTATSSTAGIPAFYIATDGAITQGTCPGHGANPIAPGTPIQTITAANCPTARTRVVDARDNHTYWVQQLADGKCWMLTNLAYSGDGANTYGDAKSLTNGTAGAYEYQIASYYVSPNTTTFTTEPASPSTSTNGTGQYGYLYNWCGAMGGQQTAACRNASTPVVNAATSVCPAGWRLPTANNGEFAALITAVNGDATNNDTGILQTFLGQYAGYWNGANGFLRQGNLGHYWSSTPSTASGEAYIFAYVPNTSSGVGDNGMANKLHGRAVRCIAN